MRFTSIAFAAFCGLAVARETSLKQRQIALLQGIIDEVQKDVQALDTAILGFTSDAKPIVAASETLIKATHDGAAKAMTAVIISDNESLTLQKSVTLLLKDVQKAVDDIIAKKSVAAANNLGGTTYGQLVAQLDGAKSLSEALISKVPAKLQPVGQSLSANIIAAVQKGVDAYSEFSAQSVPASSAATGGAAAGAAAGGAAAGAAGAGTATGTARVSNAPVAAATGASNSTAAAPKTAGAGSIRPAGAFAAVALGAVVLAL